MSGRARTDWDRVELAAAVVGHDHAVDTGVHGATRVVRVQNSFHDQASGPVVAHPGDVVPGDAGIEVGADPGSEVDRVAAIG